MVPVRFNKETYYFSVIHITRDLPDKMIYGVLINCDHYYLSKSLGINDCMQLDSQPKLIRALLDEMCELLTRFELLYLDYPALEWINLEIIKALALNRCPVPPLLKTAV